MKVYLLEWSVPYEGGSVMAVFQNLDDAKQARDEWTAHALHDDYCTALQWGSLGRKPMTEEEAVADLIRLYRDRGDDDDDGAADAELVACTTQKQIADWIVKQPVVRIAYERYSIVEKEVI